MNSEHTRPLPKSYFGNFFEIVSYSDSNSDDSISSATT
jgi:hypothetical protein